MFSVLDIFSQIGGRYYVVNLLCISIQVLDGVTDVICGVLVVLLVNSEWSNPSLFVAITINIEQHSYTEIHNVFREKLYFRHMRI